MNAVGEIRISKFIRKDCAQSNQLSVNVTQNHHIVTMKLLEMQSVKLFKKVINKMFTFVGKYADIERENRILLEKMSNIMQDNKPKLYNPSKT